ncbi:MAG: LCP family protein [Clostridia bacterium]|nr:LCP family protein [Clostridia bacterium]
MSENNYNKNFKNNNYNDNYYDDSTDRYNSKNDSQYEDIYSDSGKRTNRTRTQKPKKKRSKAKKVLTTILIIVLVLILLLTGYVTLIIFRINYSDKSPDTASVEAVTGELRSSPDVQNIMLFGADNHAENENGRSDSMILLSIDKKHHKIKQTSFLRDLYLTIPGYDEDRLNAAYSYGGAALAVETIEYNFGIKIDNYAMVDFSNFTAIIDAMGGIDLELTADEIDYINWQCWKNKQVETRHELNIDDYTFYENDNGDEVAKVHLNGRQALWYARDRDSAGSDFDRTSRQRIVINTIFTQLKSGNPLTLMRVLYEIAPLITTDMSKGSVISLGMGLISYLGYEREELSIPGSDNFSNTWVGEAQVLTIDDMDYEKERLYQFVFEE